MAAALVTSKGLVTVGVVGTRKRGTEIAATLNDQWHLGSDTKAMTATLVARLVEKGRLKWDSTVAEVFPDLAPGFSAEARTITVLQLLSHRSGLKPNPDLVVYGGADGTKERLRVVKDELSKAPQHKPGTHYEYSNLGYAIAGAITEKITGKSWEQAMRDEVFGPLGMTSVGFGGTGTPGEVDQPWGHYAGRAAGVRQWPGHGQPAGAESGWPGPLHDSRLGQVHRRPTTRGAGRAGAAPAGLVSEASHPAVWGRVRFGLAGGGTRLGRRHGVEPRRRQHDELCQRVGGAAPGFCRPGLCQPERSTRPFRPATKPSARSSRCTPHEPAPPNLRSGRQTDSRLAGSVSRGDRPATLGVIQGAGADSLLDLEGLNVVIMEQVIEPFAVKAVLVISEVLGSGNVRIQLIKVTAPIRTIAKSGPGIADDILDIRAAPLAGWCRQGP